jgi:hypothetical protein
MGKTGNAYGSGYRKNWISLKFLVKPANGRGGTQRIDEEAILPKEGDDLPRGLRRLSSRLPNALKEELDPGKPFIVGSRAL